MSKRGPINEASARGLFVGGIGTGVGKTHVSRGLTRALFEVGLNVAALKPYETGCEPNALDALALAEACARPELANARGLYRAQLPVAPYAATLAGQAPPPGLDAIVRTTRALMGTAQVTIIEGAGGLFVPLERGRDIADLVRELALPLLLVVSNSLGVLSTTFAAVEAARGRGLDVDAIVLNTLPASSSASPLDSSPPDPSRETNAVILRERLEIPLFELPATDDDFELLAEIARSGLLGWVAERLGVSVSPDPSS